MSTLFFIIFLTLAVSALCSGAEAALFSISMVRVRQFAEGGGAAAKALLQIRENMARPISTIVVLNNIANIGGSLVIGNLATEVFGSQWIGLFSTALTLAVIVFSEIIPKTLGERHAATLAPIVARPIRFLTILFTPIVWLIERIVAPLVGTHKNPTTNEAEIRLLARIGQQEGMIERDESEMIERVFRLNDTVAGHIMTPRVSITYLHADTTLVAAREHILASEHTRMLVIGDAVDEVRGIALRSELLAALLVGNATQTVAAIMRPAAFVPASMRADKLLEVFRQTRQHLSVVVDEYGGVAGVVTLEDVLEVLTGEIVDETDRVADLQAAARQKNQSRFENPPES
ncbi:MAG: HlyC/CorC family transporter [Candidatus Viridilinea halotolerans]|uniref:HlyC/CorC family transporter n=1 Tax=Candidatus Viridilinea halotolerans TaxID=2491704 RepID=A0A426TRV0_9CHLR|nr:MAG: HlyC/CorC family transporter [Candidatus Viridilinea halotolerans]